LAATHDTFALSPVLDGKGPKDTHVYGTLFICAVAFFFLGRLIGDRFGIVSDIVAIASNATCGWSWLLARSLFRPRAARASPWPLAVVLTLVAAGAYLRLLGAAAEPLTHMIANVQNMIGGTVLLLALSEPLRDMRKDMPSAERRFRIAFLSGHAMLTAVAVVWASGAPAGSFTEQWSSVIKVTCAVLAVTGAGVAIWYRNRFPLPERELVRRRVSVPTDDVLAARILDLIKDGAIYTISNLKVADLARRLNEAEYKVTQCITGALGFRNFNHMINHFRIEQAASQLADPAFDHLPVLTIALDCGFGSIGPFNRAFKAQFGDTPTAYREARRISLAA
jgi:AraC-like DNA-binding protein